MNDDEDEILWMIWWLQYDEDVNARGNIPRTGPLLLLLLGNFNHDNGDNCDIDNNADNGNNANDKDDDHVDNQTGPAAAAPPTGGLSRTGAILLSGDNYHHHHRQLSSWLNKWQDRIYEKKNHYCQDLLKESL